MIPVHIWLWLCLAPALALLNTPSSSTEPSVQPFWGLSPFLHWCTFYILAVHCDGLLVPALAASQSSRCALTQSEPWRELETEAESQLCSFVSCCGSSFHISEAESQLLKICIRFILFLSVWVFCLYVFLCTTCMQCVWRSGRALDLLELL